MIQLTFQPALDPFHCVYRLLRLRSLMAASGPIEQDRVRILDFYLLFPFRISAIRLMPSHRKYRRIADQYVLPYGDQPADQVIFDRMGSIQNAAIETLGARDLIVADLLPLRLVEVTSKPIPDEIASRITEANSKEPDLLAFLEVLASEYDLTGPNGLKARTRLLEYRYDSI